MEYKTFMEALKGKQHKLDKNKNGKLDAHDFKLLRKEESELTEATVETKKYSWGTMKTVHHGKDFSVPLHPEHHQAIAKLKDQQEHKFKDETGRHWTAKRDGDKVHLHSANDGPKTTVKHADLKEETVEEAADRMARADYKVSPSGRKSHKEIVFPNSDKDDEKKEMKEEIEELDERNKKNATRRKMMDASRGARFKAQGNYVPDAEPEHKTAQAHNKAIGRAIRKMSNEETKKDDLPFTPDPQKKNPIAKAGKFGIGPSTAKHLAKMGMQQAMKKTVKEETDDSEKTEMAQTQLHFIKYAAMEILEYIDMGGDIEEWYQNKLSKVQSEVESLHSYIEGEKRRTGMVDEEVEELDELSKSTLASYAKKSSNDARISGQIAKDFENKSSSYRKPEMKAGAARLAGEYKKRSWKREDGTMKAIDRLAKEEIEFSMTVEEFEQLDEISKKTLGSYVKKASVDMTHHVGDAERIKNLANRDVEHEIRAGKNPSHAMASHKKEMEYAQKRSDKAVKRMHGIDKAVGRLAKEEVEIEEQAPVAPVPDRKYIKGTPEHKAYMATKKSRVGHPTNVKEDLDEKIHLSKAKMGDVIKDFQASDAPQFAGKSKEKRRQMAIAAKLEADRGVKEDAPMTYKEFMMMLEYEAKGGVYRHTGTYGSEYAKKEREQDEKGFDSEKQSTEKRGRGRPAGAKSGARGPRIK